MATNLHQALYAFPSSGSSQAGSTRLFHAQRLNDILNLCVERNDLSRAKRAFAVLVRCPEVDNETLWRLSTLLAGIDAAGERESAQLNPKEMSEYLRAMMLRYADQQEAVLVETLTNLISSEAYDQALNTLEIYLPSFPYHDNAILHTYAGMLAYHTARQQLVEDGNAMSPASNDRLCEARTYFERSLSLDPDNPGPAAFLHKISKLLDSKHSSKLSEQVSDEEMVVDGQAGRISMKKLRLGE